MNVQAPGRSEKGEAQGLGNPNSASRTGFLNWLGRVGNLRGERRAHFEIIGT